MIFMTRSVFLISFVFLASCNGLTLIDFYSVYEGYQSTKKEEIAINDEFIDGQDFSFVELKFESTQLIMPLLQVSGDVFTWISSDGIELSTVNGKIIKITNSDFDFYVQDPNFECSNNASYSYDIFFQNPFLLDTQRSEVSSLDGICYEDMISLVLGKKFRNIYRLNHRGIPYYSNQFIRSDISRLELRFFYK